MANIRVKDLPNTNAANDNDEFIVDSSTSGTRRISYSELKSEISTDFAADVATYGIATLDSDNKLTASQIPDSLAQGMNFVGVANSASDLTSTTQGDFYVIQTAFGIYSVGDQAVYDGSAYVRVVDGTKEISEGGTGATTLDAAKTNLEIIDVGTGPSQVPLNQHLGTMAYQDIDGVSMVNAEVETLEVTGQVDGNLGIGGSPSSKLTVNETSGNAFVTVTSGDTNQSGVLFGDQSDSVVGGVVYDNNAETLQIRSSNNATAVTIDSSQRVGIGTSPDRPLHSYASSVATALKLDSAGIDTGVEFAHSGTVAAAINCSTGGDLEFRTGANSGANERWRIDGSNGNLVANGTAIDFGSGASTTLDDYEEGTWTPTVGTITAGPTAGAGAAYSGTYTKIGRLVQCSINLNFDNSGTSVAVDDRFTFGNLPFSVSSSQDTYTGAGSLFVYQSVGSGNNAFGTVGVSQGVDILICYITHLDGSITYGRNVRAVFTYETDA